MKEELQYERAIEEWRQQMDMALRREDGWLTLAGLFWLQDGSNRIGAAPDSEIVLPATGVPPYVGVIHLQGSHITFRAAAHVDVLLNGAPVQEAVLRSDADGHPDMLSFGSLTWFVIQRGQRYGVRLRDRDHPLRHSFAGRDWFPIDSSYRVVARFFAYDPPRQVMITNILGDTTKEQSPGYVEFILQGQTCRLEVAPSDVSAGLFLVLRDQTSGVTTYPSARFLHTAAPHDGLVELDFNRAYNPPCAFTPYATCPLPPLQNHLSLTLEAGERYSSQHDDGSG